MVFPNIQASVQNSVENESQIMKYLTKIDSPNNFKQFCESLKFLMEKDTFYHPGRTILDWPKENFYGGYGRFEDLINKIEGYEKSLLLFYKKGGKLRLHRDNSEYPKTAFSLSSEDFEFIYHGKKYNCKKGEIYSFNSKLIHGIERIEKDRWALIWWK